MVLHVLGGSGVAAAKVWSVTPPAGWTDKTDEALQRPEIKKQVEAMSHGGGMELALYQGPGRDNLLVVFIHATAPNDDGRGVEGFEQGARDGLAKLGADKSYTRRQDGNAVVVDQVVAGPGGDVHLKRIAGSTRRELYGLSATCAAPADVCAAALQSLTLDRSELQPPHAAQLTPYERGRQVGRIAAFVVAALILLALIRRYLKKDKPA